MNDFVAYLSASPPLMLLVTLAVGVAGGLLGMKLKLPAGALVGALLASMLFSVSTGIAFVPAWLKNVSMMVAGAAIAVDLDAEKVRRLRHSIGPALFILVGMLAINLILGITIWKCSDVDLMTAMFATTAGGISDMPLIGEPLGADVPTVSLLQLLRLISALIVLPMLLTRTVKAHQSRHQAAAAQIAAAEVWQEEVKVEGELDSDQPLPQPAAPAIPAAPPKGNKELAWTVAAALAAGTIGQRTGLPAGCMLFAMAAVAILNIATNRMKLTPRVKHIAQLISGSYLGSCFTPDDLRQVGGLILPALISVVGYTVLSILLGRLVCRLFHVEETTAYFATTPAGVADMALIASDLGGEGADVALFQMTRLIGVLWIAPWMCQFVVWLLA